MLPKFFIVRLWSDIFFVFGKISLFELVRWVIPAARKSYRFVEGWSLAYLVLAITLLAICSFMSLRIVEGVAVGWGLFRTFEVLIYQINVFLFDQYRTGKSGKPYAVRGYRRIVILLLQNYIEIVFWFGLFYHHWGWAFETTKSSLNSFAAALHFSIITMTGLGSSSISPTQALGYVLTSIHMTIGLFMALGILARFIALLPKPETMDEFEK